MWCIPPNTNAEFVYRMEDVLEVYRLPYDPLYPVVTMDELLKQLVKETRQPIPLTPGHPERVDYEYERNGTCNMFMIFEPLTGQRHVRVTERRTKLDWAELIKELVDDLYPEAIQIRLVMDNLNTHTPASLYARFAPEEARRITEKLDIHYTPKHGSWLNVAEIELSVLSRQCLEDRMPDRDVVKNAVTAWANDRNQTTKKVNWQFKTEDARIKLKKLYPDYDTQEN